MIEETSVIADNLTGKTVLPRSNDEIAGCTYIAALKAEFTPPSSRMRVTSAGASQKGASAIERINAAG